MNTLLFFVSSTRRSCLGRLDGILRHLTKHGCTAEVMFKAETGKTILRAINDRIYETCLLKWLSQEHEGGFVS